MCQAVPADFMGALIQLETLEAARQGFEDPYMCVDLGLAELKMV